MSRDFDLVIAGAGVIGCVAASLMLTRGVCAPGRVALVAERLPPPTPPAADWDLRVFALSRAAERVLRLCGVWSRLPPARVGAYERMCVWDASGSAADKGALRFDCAEIGEANLGFIVEGRALNEQCLQAARALGAVIIESGLSAVASGDSDVRVTLADGRILRAPLLIGADGVDSPTRAMAGIGTAGHAYHQDAIVAHVRTEQPHQGTAWQRFLDTGPLAFLPLSDGRVSVVWSTTKPEAARLAALTPEAFGAALGAASGEVLGACTLTSELARFPLRLQYATEYVGSRVALVGDAAHVVHPLAGQGLNLGLLDCAALTEVLGEAADARVLGDTRLLRRYERWRRSENLVAATAFDGLERLFSNGDPVLRGLRRAGLTAVNRVPALRREFARRALGLAGDVPAFLRSADRLSPRR